MYVYIDIEELHPINKQNYIIKLCLIYVRRCRENRIKVEHACSELELCKFLTF